MSGERRRATGARPYRRNRAVVLATSDICGICGHSGARSANHIVPPGKWPRGPDGKPLPGVDGVGNLEPAHGSMGPNQPPNPCMRCLNRHGKPGRMCNQWLKDHGYVNRPTSRKW
jgi:hypothetical protein